MHIDFAEVPKFGSTTFFSLICGMLTSHKSQKKVSMFPAFLETKCIDSTQFWVCQKAQARSQDFCQGRGVFLKLGHFDKHSPTTLERKAPRGKNISLFYLETLKNVILNEKFYPYITTIRAFFLQIRALFSNF